MCGTEHKEVGMLAKSRTNIWQSIHQLLTKHTAVVVKMVFQYYSISINAYLCTLEILCKL